MSPDCPKLRGDLVVSPQERPHEDATFVVKDPVSRRFFRFGDLEYFIARQLDGSTPLDEISRRVENRFGYAVALDDLNVCLEQLRHCGLLEDPQSATEHRRARTALGSSLLYLRLRAFDPDRTLDRSLPYLSFVFTRSFMVCSAAMLLLALGITAAGWREITRDIGGLYRFDAVLLAWLTVVAVTIAHELAHAFTCKRFGGQVHEIGLLLIYFQPAFYCNVSDAWLFPEKSRRLWVMFAGVCLDLIVWALATIAWRLTDADTYVHFLALVVMATSAVKTLFNLNPLIKLDGYYLLSDALEIPNLRQKSFAYLKTLGTSVARMVGLSEQRTSQMTREPDARLRRVYVAYGILAAVYSTWFLAMVVGHVGGFLVDRYRGTGFVIFAGVLMIAFKSPLETMLARGKAMTRWPAAAFSRFKWLRWASVIALGAVAVFGKMDLKVSGEFTVMPGHNADVRAPVAGIIEEVYVGEGDRVEAGARIARLADSESRVALKQVESEIAAQRARLRLLRAGPTPQEVELSRQQLETVRSRQRHLEKQYQEARGLHATRQAKADTAVKTAESLLEYGRKDLARSQQLSRAGLISRLQLEQSEEVVGRRQEELENARAELAIVQADALSALGGELAAGNNAIAEADGRLRVLLAGNRPEAIEAMVADITRLEARRVYLADQVRLATIVTPAAGVVVTPKLGEKLGEHVTQGALIAEVFEVDRVLPEIVVSEKEIGDVAVGYPVVLKARAYPDRSFSGRVKAIAPRAADSDGVERKVFRVTVELADRDGLLKPEMTGHAKIVCGRRTIANLLTRRFARYIRVEFWSWW
ncbi:MAG TPA: HlyD family efflux transporter periplasmic adaptor subunit [Vicinamibacterales bacterium]|nr:HlyD family efflux transporter periplasmic adaptor subunit [Vicinamibacterales bacterium]